MTEKDKKKLNYLKQLRTGEKSDTHKNEQKKTVSTNISTDSVPNLNFKCWKSYPQKIK